MFLRHDLQYIIRYVVSVFDRVHSCLSGRPGFYIINRVRSDFLAGPMRFLHDCFHFLWRNLMTRDHLNAVRAIVHGLFHRPARLVWGTDDRIFLIDDILAIMWDPLGGSELSARSCEGSGCNHHTRTYHPTAFDGIP